MLTAAYPLAQYREEDGLEVMSVSLQDVYDQFGAGHISTQAIRDFLTYARTYWDLKPSCVLIVGDGTNDPLNHNVWELEDYELTSRETGTTPMAFIQGKVIDFESGDALPENLKEITFLSGEESSIGDNFLEKINSMVSQATLYSERNFSGEVKDFYDATDSSEYKTQIMETLDAPNLFVNYLGHWGIRSMGKWCY